MNLLTRLPWEPVRWRNHRAWFVPVSATDLPRTDGRCIRIPDTTVLNLQGRWAAVSSVFIYAGLHVVRCTKHTYFEDTDRGESSSLHTMYFLTTDEGFVEVEPDSPLLADYRLTAALL